MNFPLRVRRIAYLLLAGTALSLLGACSRGARTALTVDHNDPESVLRAYFQAWEQGDWSLQASLMDGKYTRMVPEPLDSLSVLEIQALPDPSASEKVYVVDFEIRVKGNGVSMHSGEYRWTYYLSWDDRRGSWLITNYGAG
jgi:hypothetical protein